VFRETQLQTNNYHNLDNKLGKLSEKQARTSHDIIKFYPRVVNKTPIAFTNEQLHLHKGVKLYLHHKRDWIKNLALEVKNAMNFTTVLEQELLKAFSRQKKHEKKYVGIKTVRISI